MITKNVIKFGLQNKIPFIRPMRIISFPGICMLNCTRPMDILYLTTVRAILLYGM